MSVKDSTKWATPTPAQHDSIRVAAHPALKNPLHSTNSLYGNGAFPHASLTLQKSPVIR
ncbi:MAG TPA: hypothetical protein PLW66_13420 [Saprospiraceae bacterium]|nr:hypothetical protein [Saprospiraceae bacterium]HNL40448.1 hypothetical protein [Saprospiraceae bacterium]